MDMERGDLSFILNGVNLGVAFSGIPVTNLLCPVLSSRVETVLSSLFTEYNVCFLFLININIEEK